MFKIIGAVVVYSFAIFGLVRALEARTSAHGSSPHEEDTAA
ncbi:hypothetical protein PY254_03320 [Rhodanobacter sp. AS-Z3]|nr:hypothetical protein [Rhodanobacter sp. AS-Z3]WEN15718.1 hypothetical protein PY254_03320 [Rhodanobacter sp. AS-Z3]